MIGMAKACMGGTALANYVMQPEKGYELMRNDLSGDTPTEVLQEMRVIQDLNQRAVNRTFSLVISPEKQEGKVLSDGVLRTITEDFLRGLDINPEKQQFIAFVHTEKEHKHIHIIANRVDYSGKLLSDHHIGKRAQWVAHRIAEKHGLISAKSKQIENLKALGKKNDLDKDLKKEIKRKHDWVMSKKPKSVQDYFRMMNKLNVEVTPTINLSGRVQGMRMKDLATGKDFKASEVHRSLSLIQILKTGIPYERPLENNLEKQSDIELESSTSYEIMHEGNPESYTPLYLSYLASLQGVFGVGGSNDVDGADKRRKKRNKR